MDKGTRVEITGGRDGVGQHGEIFWTGPNKFGPGTRFGVRADDGATYWVLEDQVKESGAPSAAPKDPGRTYAKGDRVTVTQRGVETQGNVFWLGDSKAGGQRLGVKPDSGEEAIWIDARFVQPADGAAPAPRPSASRAPSDDSLDAGENYEAYEAPRGMDDLPPAPPLDDDEVAWRASEDGADDGY